MMNFLIKNLKDMYNGPRDFRNNKAKIFLFVPLILCLVSGVVMFLWNAILPSLLGVKFITFWQSAGLLVLCKILFGGFGLNKRHDGAMNFREKWGKSAEEKERIMEEWKKRCNQWKSKS